jgi:Ca2+-binding EF-hand superfamily protein
MWDEALKGFDLDGNGEINIKEFSAMMAKIYNN